VAQRFEHDELEFARAVTFFDAIFAFAVTLLITTVDDFSREAWTSLAALNEYNGSSLLAFAISFVVVVSFWRENHQRVTGFAALDKQLIGMNCAVMFGIVLIPFATEAMGKQDELPLPVAVYAIILSATYIMQFAVVIVAERKGLTSRLQSHRETVWGWVSAAILPLVFLGSIPVAYLVGPGAAQRCWISLLFLYPLLGWWEKWDLARTGTKSPDPAG
jgi:uncharacterized membrane protein